MGLALVFAGEGAICETRFARDLCFGRLVGAPSLRAWVCDSVWCAYTLTYICVLRMGARRLDDQCAV